MFHSIIIQTFFQKRNRIPTGKKHNFPRSDANCRYEKDSPYFDRAVRGNDLFLFTDYGFLVSPGTYEVVLNTDNPAYGGNGLTDDTVKHFTIADPLYEKEKKEWLKLYIPARTAVVLKKTK